MITREQFNTPGAVFVVNEGSVSHFDKGDLVVKEHDDGSTWPGFRKIGNSDLSGWYYVPFNYVDLYEPQAQVGGWVDSKRYKPEIGDLITVMYSDGKRVTGKVAKHEGEKILMSGTRQTHNLIDGMWGVRLDFSGRKVYVIESAPPPPLPPEPRTATEIAQQFARLGHVGQIAFMDEWDFITDEDVDFIKQQTTKAPAKKGTIMSLLKNLMNPELSLLQDYGVFDEDGDLNMNNVLVQQAIEEMIHDKVVALAKAKQAADNKKK